MEKQTINKKTTCGPAATQSKESVLQCCHPCDTGKTSQETKCKTQKNDKMYIEKHKKINKMVHVTGKGEPSSISAKPMATKCKGAALGAFLCECIAEPVSPVLAIDIHVKIYSMYTI